MRTVLVAFLIILLTQAGASAAGLVKGGTGTEGGTWSDHPHEKPRPRPRPPAPVDMGPSILDRLEPYTYLWPYAAAYLVLLGMLYTRRAIQKKIGALQGTAWELIRLMENTTPGGPRERARIAEDTTEKFAVSGNARITRSPLVSGDATTSHLTDAGLALMERHATEAAEFRSFRSALRSGIAIFLSLMVYNNTQSAFVAMKEYMRRQRDRKDSPNFAEMKTVLRLPTDWPTDRTHPLRHGLTNWDFFVIGRAVKSGRRRILSGLEYHPPTPAGMPSLVVTDDDILVAMRTYLYTHDTYPRP